MIKAVISTFKDAEDEDLISLAKEKLKNFLNSKDPNCNISIFGKFLINIIHIVKYLGLIILKDILEKDKSQIFQYKQYIVQCFNSEDPSIKARALEIIKVTVNLLIINVS